MLGAGGMGEVYLVRHPRLPRLYALKTLSASLTGDDEFRRRFVREAELAAELSHPHIVGVHDRGEFEGRLWIAMDYVDGVDAAQLLRERFPAGMPPGEVAEIVTAVADALDYAHGRQLLHRDVKPANILLDATVPNRRRILLADFGVARKTDDVNGLTATNTTVGSVAYAAPEQLMGRRLDGRADQYALAATAFHLLAGRPPFANSNPAVVISGHLNVPPPPLTPARPEFAQLDAVLAKGMAKRPEDRYPRCRDFADALVASAAATPAQPPAPPTPIQYWDQPPPRQSSQLKPAVLIPVALVALILLGGGGYAAVRLLAEDSPDSPPTTSASSTTHTTATTNTPEPSTVTATTVTASSTPSASPTSMPTTPTASAASPITISGIGSTRTVACTDNEVTVSGIGNTVTVTGHCVRVTVSGQKNGVTVDSTDAIDVSGLNNVVTYHDGSPSIERSGLENSVQRG